MAVFDHEIFGSSGKCVLFKKKHALTGRARNPTPMEMRLVEGVERSEKTNRILSLIREAAAGRGLPYERKARPGLPAVF